MECHGCTKASSETSEEEVEVKHVSIQPRRGQWLCKKTPAMAQNDAPHLKLFYIYIYYTYSIYIYIYHAWIYIYESYVIYPRISHHDSKACTVSWTFTMPKNEGFWLADLTRPQASEVVELQVEDEAPAKTGLFSHFQQEWRYMGMDQYVLIPFLGEWTSIYQLFWCSPGVQGFDTLPYI